MSGSLNVGPRLMITRDGLDRAGLMMPGSRAAERYLFRIPPVLNVEQVRTDLKNAFPEALIADFRQAHPAIERGLEEATTFLSLVSLISLIVGAIGVGTAIRAHLDQRLDSIAIMKCLGARSSADHADLRDPDRRAGADRQRDSASWSGSSCSSFSQSIANYFSIHPGLTARLGARRARNRHWTVDVAVVHGAAAARHPASPAEPDFPARNGESKPGWRERIRHGRGTAVAFFVLVVALGVIAGSLTSAPPREAHSDRSVLRRRGGGEFAAL